VFRLEAREIGDYLLLAHSTGEVLEDVVDRDPGPLYARLATTDARRDREGRRPRQADPA